MATGTKRVPWLSHGVERGSVGIWCIQSVMLVTSALLPRSCTKCFPSLVPVLCLAWGDDLLAAVCVLRSGSTPVTSGLWVPGVLWSSWLWVWPPASRHRGSECAAALFWLHLLVLVQESQETNVRKQNIVAVPKLVTTGICEFVGRRQYFPSLRQLVPCWLTGLQKVATSLK